MKQWLFNYLLKNMFGMVITDDVLVVNNKKLYLGGQLIAEHEVKSLISEVKALERMRIWSILNETPKQEALDRGWNKSTSIDELNAGKTIFYTLDTQKKILNIIKSIETTKNRGMI